MKGGGGCPGLRDGQNHLSTECEWMKKQKQFKKLKMTLTTEEWKHETWARKRCFMQQKKQMFGRSKSPGSEVPAFIHIQIPKILIYSTDNLIWVFFEADHFFPFLISSLFHWPFQFSEILQNNYENYEKDLQSYKNSLQLMPPEMLPTHLYFTFMHLYLIATE